LADALARDLVVRLDTPVRTVRQAGGRVQLDLESGERLLASHAVVAVPASVLPTIGFDPPLPAVQLGVLASQQRAVGGKVVAQYAEGDAVRSALGKAVFTDGPVNTAWVSNPYVTTGPAVVSGFVCGVSRPVLESPEGAARALDAVVEAAVGHPVTRVVATCKDWTVDPYALGIGVVAAHQVLGGKVALMVTPERRVHFAGSYTEVDLRETLEAAIRSGHRAADEVLRFPDRMNAAEIESRMVQA
jgi:monoamine oxidase